MRRSLRLRLLVGAGLWVAGALIAAGIVIASLLRDFVEGSFDERLNTNLVAVISAVAFNDRGTLVAEAMATEPRFSQPLSGWYWQIADGRSVVLRSSSLWDGSFGSEVGAVGTTGTTDELTGPNGEALRAASRRRAAAELFASSWRVRAPRSTRLSTPSSRRSCSPWRSWEPDS
jgi:hypothetical protein